ncbi:MAG: hypothetical protein NVSMB62_26380 [Acidobacteriaceae bacterium]
MPVSGARKTADIPAAAPQMSIMRRSGSVKRNDLKRRRREKNQEPMAAPP